MKVEILKENLKNGLGVVEKIVGKNLSLPILNNVLIDIEDSFLNLVSTDLETSIKIWILTKIIEKGKIVVPAKFLSSFVSSLPNEKIIMEARDQNLYIECKNLKTQIQGFNPEEFPIIPKFDDAEFLEIDNKKLCQGLAQVIDVASPSQTRTEISGIYFFFSKNNVKMVATDSFRLAEKSIYLETPFKKERSFILPQKPAREVMNILDGKDGMIKLYFSNNQVLFELPMAQVDHPQVQITSRLIDGEYPNYQDIIPQKFKTTVTLKRDEFLNQIKIASLFSGKVNEVKLSVNSDKKEIEVSAKSQDIGENKSSLPATISGDSVEISFNYKFLVEGLQNIKSSEVIFSISKEDGPCILKPVGDESYIYMVMPIKSI